VAERGKGLSDEALGALVDSKLGNAVSWYSGALSKEREKVLKYYNGELPAKQREGSSSYISNEVYDSVEAMKAQLLETFSAGREIVKFDPLGPEDVDSARIATSYTDHVVFSQNTGYQIFSDVIHDGLVARIGIAKVYWQEDTEHVEEQFEDYPEEAVMMTAAGDDVHSLNADQQPESGLYSGTLVRKKDNSYAKIEVPTTLQSTRRSCISTP
jgi:hypothetical protein